MITSTICTLRGACTFRSHLERRHNVATAPAHIKNSESSITLKALEANDNAAARKPLPIEEAPEEEPEEKLQMTLSGGSAGEIVEELKALDVNTLTPIEAMTKLYELVNKAKQ